MVLLSLGFNVLVNDVDVMWVDDPLPFIPTDADFAAQHGGCSRTKIGYDINNDLVNTGFIFVKSANRTLEFYRDVMNLSLSHHRYVVYLFIYFSFSFSFSVLFFLILFFPFFG